jgi:hypothetical protein
MPQKITLTLRPHAGFEVPCAARDTSSIARIFAFRDANQFGENRTPRNLFISIWLINRF